MLSAAGLGLVAAGIAIVDETCRRYLLGALHGDFPTLPSMPDVRVAHMARAFGDTLGIPAASQAPLMLFAAFGLVLFVLLFKS